MVEMKKPVLRLDNPVVRRVVPMTEECCDRLRAIRNHLQDEIRNKQGIDVDIPFPTVIHIMTDQYCELKGIQIDPQGSSKS